VGGPTAAADNLGLADNAFEFAIRSLHQSVLLRVATERPLDANLALFEQGDDRTLQFTSTIRNYLRDT